MFNDDEVMYLVMDSSSFGRRGEGPSKGMITVPMLTKHSKPSRLVKKVVPISLFSSDCQSLSKFYHYFGDFVYSPNQTTQGFIHPALDFRGCPTIKISPSKALMAAEQVTSSGSLIRPGVMARLHEVFSWYPFAKLTI